jgi:3-dehydroquinate synthetase
MMQDPFEAGFRAALNLGHTVGHAVEIASNFQLRHGEAVAIGMVVEARLAEKLGLTETGIGIAERIKDVLAGIGLPTEVPAQMVLSTIIQAMKVDKKKELDMIKFALPLDIGRVQVGVGVAISDLEVVL